MSSAIRSQHNFSFQKRIIYNSWYSLINSIGSNILNLVCTILLARYLGAKDYGIIIFANYLMLFMFSGFGNDLSGLKLVAQVENEPKQLNIILRGILLYHLLFAGFCSILLFSFATFFSNSIPANIYDHFFIISVIVIFNLFTGMFASLWDGFQRIDWSMLADVVLKGVKLFGFVVLLFFGFGVRHILLTWAWVYIVFALFVLPFFFWLFIRKKDFTKVVSGSLWSNFPHKTYLVYGFFLKCPALLRSFIPLIISFYLGYITVDTSDIGIYGAAISLASAILIFASPTSRALFPSLSQFHINNEKEQFVLVLKMVYRYVGLLAFLGVAFIILSSDKLVQFIYGNEFLGSSKIIGYLCVAIFFESLKHISGTALNATNHASIVTMLEIFSAVFTTIAGFLLIWRFGVAGAAITGAMASTITSVIELVLVQKLLKIKLLPLIISVTVATLAFLVVIWNKNMITGILLVVPLFFFAKDFSIKEVVGLVSQFKR